MDAAAKIGSIPITTRDANTTRRLHSNCPRRNETMWKDKSRTMAADEPSSPIETETAWMRAHALTFLLNSTLTTRATERRGGVATEPGTERRMRQGDKRFVYTNSLPEEKGKTERVKIKE